ncbi:MAG: polyheme membrane-associated cytochrome C [Anaerolineaceae bacterium]|nr:MAG: polyheme membrane-associated cytochrome C [Anaerolineaceae bacterium]
MIKKFFDLVLQYRVALFALVLVGLPALIIAVAIMRVQSTESVETITAHWTISGHADFTSRSFTFWDDNDPPMVPADCAACHSLHGMLDFVGERGTAAGSVSADMPIGSVVSCAACHNDAVHQMQMVTFPSSAVVEARGSEASCLMCHQGTESADSVDQAIGGLDDDVVYDELGFINVHYHVSAATMMGTTARGGYEYPMAVYEGRFEHTPDFQTCSSCHDAHNLRVEPLQCSTCHSNVVTYEDLRDIRDDRTDYDGDGDTRKGIALEIDTFHDILYEAIRTYADEVLDAPIVYSSQRFPYFFNDVSEGGEIDPADLNFGNRYTTWSPRLVRVAYNYHFVQKDPGAYAHNPRYTLQLLYDSISDINQSVPVEMAALTRP